MEHEEIKGKIELAREASSLRARAKVQREERLANAMRSNLIRRKQKNWMSGENGKDEVRSDVARAD